MTVLIDPGSNSTLFREGAIRVLKLHGSRQTLRINGVADSLTTFQSEYLELPIKTFFVEVATLKESTLPSVTRLVPFFKWETLRKRWQHLDYLPELRLAGARIHILIGLNTLTTPTESRIEGDNELTAEKTRLGWFLKE